MGFVTIQYFSRKSALWIIGTKPGQNLQSLVGPLWTKERGTLHSCQLLRKVSRLGIGVNKGPGRSSSCSVAADIGASVMTGSDGAQGRWKSCSVGSKGKAVRSLQKTSCKLKRLSLKLGLSSFSPWLLFQSPPFLGAYWEPEGEGRESGQKVGGIELWQ